MAGFGMVGTITAVEGKRDELAKILLKAAEVLRGAEGCLLYLVHIPEDQPDAIIVTEAWENEQAHRASLSIPEVGELIATGRPLIAKMEGSRTRVLGGVGAE